MSDHHFRSVPLLGVNFEDVGEEVLNLGGNVAPGLLWEVELAALDLLEEDHVVFVVERGVAAEQNVEHDPNAPVIALLSVGLL